MTPIMLTLTHLVITKKNLVWVSLFAFGLSQQLFTGSPQMVLLTLLVIGVYAVVTLYRQDLALSFSTVGRVTLGVVLGVGIAAIQLLPSAEMLRESVFPGGFSPEEASYYSFPLVHLKTLIAPFALGNPKMGTYPPFTTFDGSIFWENNVFIGLLPIALLFLGFTRPGLAWQGLASRRFHLAIFLAIAIAASFLFMLGKYSPVYLFYSVWPLNLFRVASRFAWIFLITIVTTASWSLTSFLRQQRRGWITALATIVIALHTYQLITTWWDYHAIVPARLWLTPTPFIEEIKKNEGSVRTIGSELVHNKQFLKAGWNGKLDRYRFLTNAAAPNSNLYWDIRQTDVYAGRFLKRPSLVESLMGSEIKSSDSIATISAQGTRLLDLYHAATIVSAIPLDMEKSLPIVNTTRSADLTITAYRNPDAIHRAYLATQPIVAPTFSKAAESLKNPTFIPGVSVLIHDQSLLREPLDSEDSGGRGTVEITREGQTRVTMRADVRATRTILVFGDTYYPGWQATIDGQPTKIFPVNIKERGILISGGVHEIVWQYQPKSVAVGAWISGITIIIALLLLFFSGRHVSGKQE
ncbi:hypothetical protein HY411_00195 [Candidatus Gottesmanbacteria bacterium]|nr:hypothetical protein [Candidatus Gottesmanbacteria bacterium]